MQSVMFVDSNNQNIAAATMDVPRQGELVIVQGHAFTAYSVRYYVYPNNVVHAIVVLTPLQSANAIVSHYESTASR